MSSFDGELFYITLIRKFYGQNLSLMMCLGVNIEETVASEVKLLAVNTDGTGPDSRGNGRRFDGAKIKSGGSR